MSDKLKVGSKIKVSKKFYIKSFSKVQTFGIYFDILTQLKTYLRYEYLKSSSKCSNPIKKSL